jgi:hypothetical protein
MRRSMVRFWPSLLALALLAAPAGAELYRVTLNSGQTVETAYQPQEASWDASMVLLLTEVGNWIGISKADVQKVDSINESGGYGVKIATNTFEMGISPNDLPDPNGRAVNNGGGADARVAALQTLLDQQQAAASVRQAQESYTLQQFVEPNQTQGVPPRLIGMPPGLRPDNQ